MSIISVWQLVLVRAPSSSESKRTGWTMDFFTSTIHGTTHQSWGPDCQQKNPGYQTCPPPGNACVHISNWQVTPVAGWLCCWRAFWPTNTRVVCYCWSLTSFGNIDLTIYPSVCDAKEVTYILVALVFYYCPTKSNQTNISMADPILGWLLKPTSLGKKTEKHHRYRQTSELWSYIMKICQLLTKHYKNASLTMSLKLTVNHAAKTDC